MRILGAELPRSSDGVGPTTLVLLGPEAEVATVRRFPSLPALTTGIAEVVSDEPFLLAVNLPMVVGPRTTRGRTVESLIHRRLGFRLPARGRGAAADGVNGETLIAGLAAAGHACLPYPERDRRKPGLAECHPRLTLKVLLWESSPLSGAGERATREQWFRSYTPPAYRASDVGAKVGWAERTGRLDMTLRALVHVPGFDLEPTRQALHLSSNEDEVEAAGALFDATLMAGTLRRYVEAPETCLFLGERGSGYVILPADGLVRSLALRGAAAPRDRLFPQASLRDHLGGSARLRSGDLLSVPGRPQRTEATFREAPHYEFDNRDEMLWWKHCRHLAGPALPTQGLRELLVVLGSNAEDEAAAPLKLERSRHRTLSFRFEPPTAWRARIPTRDGRTYGFRVLRAVYETSATPD